MLISMAATPRNFRGGENTGRQTDIITPGETRLIVQRTLVLEALRLSSFNIYDKTEVGLYYHLRHQRCHLSVVSHNTQTVRKRLLAYSLVVAVIHICNK